MYLNLIWLSGFYSVVPYLSKIKNWEQNDKHNYSNLDQLTKNRYEMTTIDTHHEVKHHFLLKKYLKKQKSPSNPEIIPQNLFFLESPATSGVISVPEK